MARLFQEPLCVVTTFTRAEIKDTGVAGVRAESDIVIDEYCFDEVVKFLLEDNEGVLSRLLVIVHIDVVVF